jgi:hypothetical protein
MTTPDERAWVTSVDAVLPPAGDDGIVRDSPAAVVPVTE